MQEISEDHPTGNNKDEKMCFEFTEKNEDCKKSQNGLSKKEGKEVDSEENFTKLSSLLMALEPLEPPPVCKTCYSLGYGRTCMVTDVVKPKEVGNKRSGAPNDSLEKEEQEPELMRKKFKTGYVPAKFIPTDESLRNKLLKRKKKREGGTIESEKSTYGGIISNPAALRAPPSSQGLERSSAKKLQLQTKSFLNPILEEDVKITEQNEMEFTLEPLNLATKGVATPQPKPDGFLKHDEKNETRKKAIRAELFLLENLIREKKLAAAKKREAMGSAIEKSNIYKCCPPRRGILLSNSCLTVRKKKNVRYVDGFRPGDEYYADGHFKIADNGYEQVEKWIV